jgi:hypothetical protein
MKQALLIKIQCRDYAVLTRALNSLNCVFRETIWELGKFVTHYVKHKIKSQSELSCIKPLTFRHVYVDTWGRFRRTEDLVVPSRRADAFMGTANIRTGIRSESFYLFLSFHFHSQFGQRFLPAADQSKIVRFRQEARFFATRRKMKINIL